MLNVGSDTVAQLFTGDMGIKTAAVGDDIVYTRPGGYFYIELTNDKESA